MVESLRNLIMSTDDAETGFKILKEHENELTSDDKKLIYSAFSSAGTMELSEEDLDGVVGGNLFDTVSRWFLPKSFTEMADKMAKARGYSSAGEETWAGIKNAASTAWDVVKNSFKPKNTIDGAVGYF